MLHRARRRRTPLVIVAVTAWLTVPAWSAAGAQRPVVWSGDAAAAAVNVLVDTEPGAVPVETLVDARLPDAVSDWDSSGAASARATLFHPGETGTGGPQLLCDLGLPCPPGFPPDYPLTAYAEHPSQPRATGPTGYAHAEATPDHVRSSARPANVVGLEPIAAAITVGAASAQTHQEFVDGVLVARARSHLEDVVLGGGALTIRALDVVAVSRADAGAGATSEATVTLVGVESAQGGVVVDQRGVTIGGQQPASGVVDQLNQALADALEGTAVSARIVGAGTESAGGATRAHGAGLFVSVEQPVSGPALPQVPVAYRTYVVHATLGQAGTRAYAADDVFAVEHAGVPMLGAPTDVGTTGGSVPGTVTGGQVDLATGPASGGLAFGSAPPPASTGTAPATGGGASAPPPAVAAPADEGGGTGFGLLAGAASEAVGLGYAGVALAAAAVLLASRLGARRLREG